LKEDKLRYDVQECEICELLIQDYFKRIKSRDLHGLLSLFSEDPVIHEPFSKSKHISGKSEIESFFRTVIMANEGVQQEVKIEKERYERHKHKNSVTALVIFRKENAVKARFTFGFEDPNEPELKSRIKTLNIEFID
jgi:hypothetical protein